MMIFVGNLAFDATQDDVKKLFEGFGGVASVKIVTEKKADKSRGFGFVEMPDNTQAAAAITALDGQEFMGRPLNVAVSTKKFGSDNRKNKNKALKHAAKAGASIEGQDDFAGKQAWFQPVYEKKSGYGKGRRSQSYLRKKAPEGVVEKEAVSRHKRHENPMRWRKRSDQTKPRRKSSQEFKPWEQAEGKSRPWKKADSEQRVDGGRKPWMKTAGSPGKNKPWWKSENPEGAPTTRGRGKGRPQPPWFKGRKKTSGDKNA